ncbi:right-handed parallel beta-helix repeat-containing protein [Sphingomonas quercus]|uniref:Right-handed parallel beta-helix repeat-containing protein n=1 Tax=Sphingomonas quercus TaxID=2842451 RepID=A0ABS6BH93_9SPHN|nr:right-handed parallel beta-helix repeat-containing protein [Sphingomonas quercus]MBU3077673.1 right-handed parallel beta-helix repeat-containing protein [Sphingomonas quercus]
MRFALEPSVMVDVNVPRYNVEYYRTAGGSDIQALQAAIDAVNAIGGGVVTSTKSVVYQVHDIQLKPNVTLYGINMKGTAGSSVILNLPGGTDNVTIEGCYFDGTAMSAAGSQAITSPAGQNSYDFHVLNNRFKMLPMPTNPANTAHAWVMNSVWGVFTGNYCDQASGDIYNFNGGFVLVTDNIAMNSGDGGIALNNGVSGVVANNYIANTSLGVGIGPNSTLAYLLVSDNLIDGCQIGIAPGSYGGIGPHHLKIDSNNIRHCGEAGISYNGNSSTEEVNVSITNNLVTDSSLSYSGAGGQSGIVVNRARGAHVTGNQVINCAGFAYYFDGSTSVTFDSNTARISGYPVIWVNNLGSNSASIGENHFIDNINSRSAFPNPQYIISGKLFYYGTLDGSGSASFSHGLSGGLGDVKRVESHSGYAMASGNYLVPLTMNAIDGSNVSVVTSNAIQGSQPLRPFAFTLTVKPEQNPGF